MVQCYTRGTKSVNDAAGPPESGPAETRGLSTSSLPWSVDRPARMPDSPVKNLCTKQRSFLHCLRNTTSFIPPRYQKLRGKFFFLSLRVSDYCLHLYSYFHNISTDMSSGLLQVFVELGNLHGTSNYVLYRIHAGHLF